MKYIIMDGGKGTRWNNYSGITKQEAIINGENLLERIVRLIYEFDENANIIILSNNEAHRVPTTTLHSPLHSNYYKNKYCYELIDEPLIYLYGDTFYERDSIRKIIEMADGDVLFYGNSKAIIGLKINNVELFKQALDLYRGPGSLYNYFKKLSQIDNKDRFRFVGNEFYNINYGKDYESLKKVEEKLFYEGKLLCNGIIWNIGLFFKDNIIKDIDDHYRVSSVDFVSMEDDCFQFLSELYDGYLSEQTIKEKYSFMSGLKSEFVFCKFEVDSPHFEIQPQKNQIACLEVTNLKRYLRRKYKLPTMNNYSNIIHMSDTPIEYLNNMEVISGYLEKPNVKTLKLK